MIYIVYPTDTIRRYFGKEDDDGDEHFQKYLE